MKVQVKQLQGNWNKGYALDKHMVSSTFTGYNEAGHPQFDNQRTEVGEAVYRLKYKSDWDQSGLLAAAVVKHICPLFPSIGLVVPMPASQARAKQPVNEVADAIAKSIGVTSFDNLITKAPSTTGQKLKDLHTRAEKDAELAGKFSIVDAISGDGKWNVLLVDDLFDSGASMTAATAALKTYNKISGVYVVALTWK